MYYFLFKVEDFDDFMTPANFSSNLSSVLNDSNVQKTAIQESIIDESGSDVEEEELSSPNDSQDEVDKQTSHQDSLIKAFNGSKKKHRGPPMRIESSEEDENESYQVQGKHLLSGDGFENDSDGDPEESISWAGRGRMVIRSSGENSAEHSDAEDVGVDDSHFSNGSSADSAQNPSPEEEDSFQLRTTKKQGRTTKPLQSSNESSLEATPRAHRQRSGNLRNIDSDDTEEEVVSPGSSSSSRDQSSRTVDSDASTEEEQFAPRLSNSSRIPTPRMIQDALIKTGIDRQTGIDSGNDSSSMDPVVQVSFAFKIYV